ncbi:MAG TPA: NADH-quinone oxidoreductase subunit J [Rhodospirillales bacterium]|jgi:NADH-quinone oxidoreductase subunit J|nr:MAG: NADH-quinone oxidoreductase subunit J [Alphaproteobacteria bacterium MarineAlpha3_Bin1]HIM26097.1 NADH-quinone oxidoreductase subunit J [Rhodospirillales bacterium]HIM77864.1 NADH-quinone oxidoreductase subunit J [Rhodospirillales bacterium]
MIQALTFYVFAFFTVVSGALVISARNPVHSVLFLILAFFSSAGLFVLMGAEFLAMILVVVYVGAVAVLFLFVVMMLDINFVELRQGFLQYLPAGVMIGLVLLVELVVIVAGHAMAPEAGTTVAQPIPPVDKISNTQALGELFYTHYIYLFQAAGLILLVAMIGAIVLTHRKRDGVRKQRISDQINRRAEDSVEVVKVETGKGI